MTSEKLFVCQFCPSSFATRDSHYLHQCDVHMALMCCSFCSFHLDPNRLDIDQIDQMRNHLIYSHLRQKSWYCVRCWQEFSQKTDLLAHLTRAHSVRFGSYSIADTKCDLCGMILPSITSYQHHHQVSHTCLDARCGLIESLKRLNEEFAVQPEVQKSKKVELKSEPITNLVKRMSYASKGYWAPMRSEKKPTKAALIPREKTRQVAKLMCLHCQNRFVESDLLGHLRGVWLKDKNALVYCEECCQPARDMKEFRTHLTCLHREQLRVEHKCQKCRYACASAEALQVHFENFHRAKECPNCHLYLVNLISYSYGHQKICKEHSNGTPVDISQRVQSLVDSLKVTVRNDTTNLTISSIPSTTSTSKQEVELVSTTGFIEHGKLIEYPSEDTSELYYGTITEPILETLAQLNHKQWANQKPILIPPVADISQPMQILTEPHTPTVFKMPKFDHNDNSTVIPPAYQAQLKPARGQQHRRRPNRFPQGRARMSHQKCSINSGNFFVGRCGPVESRSNIGDYGLAKDLRATLTKGHRALELEEEGEVLSHDGSLGRPKPKRSKFRDSDEYFN